MNYIVMYDISDDKCRLAIAEYLEGRGQRIQESVFECVFTDSVCKNVVADLKKMLGEKTGNIRLYPLCSECFAGTVGIGEVKKSLCDDGYAVF